MKNKRTITLLFTAAALYEGLLGIAFLFASEKLFQWFDVTPPNHLGYVQFSAALLLIFSLMFAAISMRPARNRNLIPFGILLKVSYCSVVMFHWFTSGLPNMWMSFCIADLIFLVFFVWAWAVIGKRSRESM